MAAPFTMDGMSDGGFSMGTTSAAAAMTDDAPAVSTSSTSSTVVPPCTDVHSFPLNLTSPSLPPCPVLHAQPALHALRGRVLVASRSFEPGETVLHEHAFLTSNWDDFRCAVCDQPHLTRSCAEAKTRWTKKVLAKMDRVEGTIMEAAAIGELDHARSFIKLLNIYHTESVLGKSGQTSALKDFLSLSYTHYAETLHCLQSKLPFQNTTPKAILEDASLWPSGLSVEEGAKMLAILNTNSHELTDIRGTGIFLRASLMEHSCMPNCNFSTTGRELQIIALRKIAAGDNLSIDYGEGFYRPVSKRRQNLLRSHGFTCFCEACTIHPDRSRGFTCPTQLQNGQTCPGIVYPVGMDNREQELKDWQESVTAAAASVHASPLPYQPFSATYPTLLMPPWSCLQCRQSLNSEQIQLCLAREKLALKKLKDYRFRSPQDEQDEEDEQQEQFDFDAANKKGHESDEDEMADEEDENESDEILPPSEVIAPIFALPAPTLHPSHHIYFWSLDSYAHQCCRDWEVEVKAFAKPVFLQILGYVREFLRPIGQELHDSLPDYSDKLAQVFVATGEIQQATAAFQQAYQYSCLLNGSNHHLSLDLKELVEDTPTSTEELEAKYQEFQEGLEALAYDIQVKETKKKNTASTAAKKPGQGKKNKKKGQARSNGLGLVDSDEDEDQAEDELENPIPGLNTRVTRATQEAVLQKLLEMGIQQRAVEEEAEVDPNQVEMKDGNEATTTTTATKAKNKKKKKKGKK